MAIGIDDLDDDDLLEEGQQPTQQEPLLEPASKEDDEDSLISLFLKTKGIEDMSKIKFETDDGNIEERDWSSLDNTEKLNILNTPINTYETNDISNLLNNEEIELINNIRKSNMSPSQYIELFSTKVQEEPRYKIDDLSDDELFILDLESRAGELSDEVIAQALNNAKQNEELFNKQIEGIRKEYKEREDYLEQQQQNLIEQEQLEAYNAFQDSVIDSINNFNSVGNLDLNFEDSDREELAQFMLSKDEAGNNYLWQALQDPDTLVKAAWFVLNGDEAFNNISDYFVNLIKLVSENQYKKGFEEGKSGQSPTRPQVVIRSNRPEKQYKTIDDLDD